MAYIIKEVLPKKREIELAYEAMANDMLRETEALNWCNLLIGDNVKFRWIIEQPYIKNQSQQPVSSPIDWQLFDVKQFF